jgi:transcriptional regulator with XRE-family HTH domain
MMQIVERLRQAREDMGIDLEALAHRTRLRAHLLEAVEQGRFDALPRGVYARAVVRAYAEAVGLDPNRVVTEVAALLPEPEDPIEGLARVRGIERPPPSPSAGEAPVESPVPGAARTAIPLARAAAVAALDTTVLLAFTAIITVATAAVSGVTVPQLVELAAVAILVQALLAGALYFILLGGIGGATLGERIVEPQASRRRFRGTLPDATRRAGHLALREASFVLSAAMPWPSPGRTAACGDERRARPRLEAGALAR